LIVVHSIAKPSAAEGAAGVASVVCRQLESNEPIPQGAIWIDLIEPSMEEDQKVQEFVGVPVPTKADPDYTEPPEAHYSENGVRYLHALFISEPDDTPDVTGVTFVLAPTALVTVRYYPVESFDLFSQKLCKSPGQALFPDAVAVGLINTALNRSARALSKAGESLDRIASAVFRAKGDQSNRNKIYSDTLNALGREDEKISNLRESMVSVERLLLFLMSEGRPEHAPKPVREATKTALRDLQSLEEDASFKAQKVQFPARRHARPHQPCAERHHQALFGARGHLHAPDRHRLDLRHEFQGYAGARMALGLSAGDRPDGVRGGAAVSLLPLEEVAVEARFSLDIVPYAEEINVRG